MTPKIEKAIDEMKGTDRPAPPVSMPGVTTELRVEFFAGTKDIVPEVMTEDDVFGPVTGIR